MDVTAAWRQRFARWWIVYPRYWRYRVASALLGDRFGLWLVGHYPLRTAWRWLRAR